MKAKVKGLWFLLLTQVLSLLGFQSCRDIDRGEDIICEYGVPHADYTVKVTVSDETEKPIEGIRVVIERSSTPTTSISYPNSVFSKDTLYTDDKGAAGFSIKGQSYYTGGYTTVYLDDVDGEENGEFESMTVKDVKAEQTVERDRWYEGAYEARIVVRMKSKE